MAQITISATKDASGMIDPAYTSDLSPAESGGDQLWNGAEEHFVIGRTTSDGFDYIGRGLVYFPITFTGIQTLDSAVLEFRQHDRSSNHHAEPQLDRDLGMYVRRMLRDWGEAPNRAEAVWSTDGSFDNSYKKIMNKFSSTNGAQNWTTEDEAHWTGDQQDDNWESIDVTDIVTAWWEHSKGQRSNAPNYGLIMINDAPTVRVDGFNIYTTESGFSPRLVVTYNSNNAPLAPTTASLAPKDDTIVNTTIPTFTGTRNDPDSGDYITAIQIVVYQDNGTTIMWDSGQMNQSGQLTTFSRQYAYQVGINPGGPQSLIGNTFYKWKVRTADKAGAWSPYSAVQRFKTNTVPNAPTLTLLQSPTSDVKTLTPTFIVQHNDNDPNDTLQYGYQIIVETSAGVPVWDSGNVDLATLERANTKQVTSPSLVTWGASFRVKARTKDSNAAWSNFSSYVAFTIHGASVPLTLAPSSDEVTPSLTPTFTGSRANTTDTINTFQIILYDDNLTQVWDSGTLSGTSPYASFSKLYNGPALTQGTYFQWKVRITSSIGGTSAYSALQRFRTPSDASVPEQTSPIGTAIQGLGSNPLRPAFVGTRAATFNRYQIEVYPGTATTGNLGTAHYASGTQSATISGAGPYTFTLAADTVTALSWGTQYKWRARVSADAGSTWSAWSGLASFRMDVAGTPDLDDPTPDEWITDATPTFQIDGTAGDTIDQMQVRVYDSNGTTLIWDSGMTNVTEVSGVATLDYAGPTLTGGWYWWEAKYQKTTNGPIGEYADKQRFRLNSPPNIPTDLEPLQNAVLLESLTPTFKARFTDPDTGPMEDEPTEWEIVVEEVGVGLHDTLNITTDLQVGLNEYEYDGAALDFGVDYQWKTRFKDTKGEWGQYSGYRIFHPAIQPNSTSLVPTDEATVNSVRPTISWTYDDQGGTDQHGINVKVYEIVDLNDEDVPPARLAGPTSNEVWVLRANIDKPNLTANEYTFESNFFQNLKVYAIVLTVFNEDGLDDPSPQTVRVWCVLDAPDPVSGLAPTTNSNTSVVHLEWDASTMLSGHTFVEYRIYKRLKGDLDWTLLDTTTSLTEGNAYDDYYAGHGILYEYKVTVVTTKSGVGIELESGDSNE